MTAPAARPGRPAPGVRLLRGAVHAVPEGSRPWETDLWLPERPSGPVPVARHRGGG